jgi:hypothetical protein
MYPVQANGVCHVQKGSTCASIAPSDSASVTTPIQK